MGIFPLAETYQTMSFLPLYLFSHLAECCVTHLQKRRHPMPSPVTEIPAADSHVARAHFEAMLSFETDCWDTHEALKSGASDFALIDVRSPAMFAAGHIPGAVNIPHGKITASRMAEFAAGVTFIVYCAGPHCNGANKGAIRLARLGLPVKMMIGGITGWLDEGFALTQTGDRVARQGQMSPVG
jgi:rhodanese-related sulfurtransferase